MKIVLVDNNTSDLSLLAKELTVLLPECQIQSFTDPLMSAKYICNNDVDAAFIATEMRPVNGFVLLRALQVNKPKLPVVMLSEAESALGEMPKDCFRKPVTVSLLETVVKQILA